MRFINPLRIVFLLLSITLLCLCSFGCAGDDNQQIRSVIDKFYHQFLVTQYLKGQNDQLVLPEYVYYTDDRPYAMLVHMEWTYKEIEFRFSRIDIQEDYAMAYYTLIKTLEDGEERSAFLKSYLFKDNGRWKLKYTRPG